MTSSRAATRTASAHIRAAELQRSRLRREREDLVAGKGRDQDRPIAAAIREQHRAEVNIARLERNLAGSRSSRAQRRTWRSEMAGWRSSHATAARAEADLRSPELARIDEEERGVNERLSGLWEQRETRQRWVTEHPEASRRLDHLTIEIDNLDDRLALSRSAHDRARVSEPRGVVLDRGLGIDL